MIQTIVANKSKCLDGSLYHLSKFISHFIPYLGKYRCLNCEKEFQKGEEIKKVICQK